MGGLLERWLSPPSVPCVSLVRHGESLGNVAATEADSAGGDRVDVESRDADMSLSETGRAQAEALGAAIRGWPANRTPQSIWCSPYRRAGETAEVVLRAAGLGLPIRFDDRLRDRDLGILDRLTGSGIAHSLPDEAARRRWIGKFYYRPPGGEAWTDVALRVRSVLADLDRLEGGRRVMIFSHDVVVLMFRYVFEHLDEHQVLEIGKTNPVRNASVTSYRHGKSRDGWSLLAYNDVSHLEGLDFPTSAHAGDSHGEP